jgi:hypothetical protein
MPIVLVEQTAASVPTPAAGKAAIFVDSVTGQPYYKNDAGTVASLVGATGAAPAFGVACSDETTALTTGTAKTTFRMPYAMTLGSVRASLTTAQASGSVVTVDINVNGASILSTKLTIDNTEKTSVTAAVAAVISSASIPDDAEITIDIDQVGDGTATGLKVWLIPA